MSTNLSKVEPSCMSMTAMFLAKLMDSGIIEHRRRTDAAMASWQDRVYRNKETGQESYILGDENPDPMFWEKC